MEEVVHNNKLNIKNFTYHVCQERISMIPIIIWFQKSSFLKVALDRKIQLLKSNGLINYWISKHMDYNYLNVKKAKQGPETLNISQLLGGFQLLLFGLFLSMLSFALEHVSSSQKFGKLFQRFRRV